MAGPVPYADERPPETTSHGVVDLVHDRAQVVTELRVLDDAGVGMAGTPAGVLWWLAGVVRADDVDATTFRVTIDPWVALERTPQPRRDRLRRGFEDGQVELVEGTQVITGTVTLDGAGLVAALEVTVPAGEAGMFGGAAPARGWQVAFDAYDEPVELVAPETTT